MEIKNFTMQMTRGDSETITVECEDFPFVNGEDVIEFTVRKRASSAEKAIYKRIDEFEPDGTAIIELRPEDTEGLAFGGYVYDVQLTSGGAVVTIIKPNAFILTEEVSYG